MLRPLLLRLLGRQHPLLRLARRLRDDVLHPRLLEPQVADRVLVLAPHMDDEAIGCGGAVLRHRELGSPVAVVYLSDGAEGDLRLADPAIGAGEAKLLRANLRAERRAEAQRWCAAAGALGHFLDLPDGRLADYAGSDAVQRVADLLDLLRPSIVYLPSPLDVHADHRAANRLALDALRRARLRPEPRLRGYEVWTPVLANAVMDIGAVAEAKARLLGLHASQLRDIDYVRLIMALNTYRALLLPGRHGHAEAFVELAPRPYEALLAD